MAKNVSGKTLQKFLDGVPWTKVFKKAAAASKGDRLYPSRTEDNDRKKNFRLDKGSNVDGSPELILQANKNAENPGVKKAAQENSHAILAKTVAKPADDTEGELAKKSLFESFRKLQDEK